MMIFTDRHRPEDMSHWRICERIDATHARRMRSRLAYKADMARAALRNFIETKKDGYLGISWGKDSVVCAHLLHQLETVGVSYPAVWVCVKRWENPDCKLVRDAFFERWPLRRYEEIEVDAGVDRAGGTSAIGFAEAARRHGRAHVSGVRGDESAIRRIVMLRHGTTSASTCRPIVGWSTQEVFAYSSIHDLPLHPAYAYTMGGIYDRMHLRTASLGGERGTEYGRAEWEQAYYSDHLRMDLEGRAV